MIKKQKVERRTSRPFFRSGMCGEAYISYLNASDFYFYELRTESWKKVSVLDQPGL